jgi:hypothetical protein
MDFSIETESERKRLFHRVTGFAVLGATYLGSIVLIDFLRAF